MPGRPPLRQAALDAMSQEAREAYLYSRNRPANKPSHRDGAMLLKRDMDLERAFVAAGGLLLAGQIPPAMEESFLDLATSARSNCWWRPDLQRKKPSKSPH